MARPGDKLGAFEVLDPLGSGGMGEVYRAHDVRLQRHVALKLLPPAHAGDDEARARLLREARAAAALNHPHICTIYEVGEADGQVYIAMELVDGQPLDRCIPAQGLPASTVHDYARQVVDAVAHAHASGILHRDLKTSNIMVTSDGRVKVLDFGLAKRTAVADPAAATTGAVTMVSRPGRITGTLAYMSPEQLRGQPATAASDVWGLGVVLHEMAAGERPFEGQTSFEVASAILEQPPRSLPPRVPDDLRTIVARALAKDPARRYRSAVELRAALESTSPGEASLIRPTRVRLPAVIRRRPRIASAVALVLAVALLYGTGVARRLLGTRAPAVTSIAVLPLENISNEPDEEHLASGIQAGLISELARIRSLDRVIERASTRRFAGSTQPIGEIAAALGVDAVLTGSVMRAGGRVQVTAQLIEAATARHLWADRFERDTRDVLSVQNDVAAAVAEAIGGAVSPENRRRWTTARAVDPETYESYLRGMHLVARGTGTRGDRLKGLAILQEAVDRDPGNAHAYAGLAAGYVTLGHGPAAEADAWAKARAAALRAVTLDPGLAEAHSALAEVRTYYERDWSGAEASFKRANDLNPNLAFNHYHYAWYLALFSRWDEAIAEHKRAQELDPLTPPHTAHLGTLYLYQDRYEDALSEARKATEFAAKAPVPWLVLGRALFHLRKFAEAEEAIRKGASLNPPLGEYELGMFLAGTGRSAEARAILQKLEAQPAVPFNTWSLSQLNIALGDHDRAFYWLHRRPAHAFLPWIRVHPPYRAIRHDPRFAALMTDMKLPMP